MVVDLQKVLKENKRLKEKKSKKSSKDILSKLKEKVVSKPIVKSNKVTVYIPERKVENIWNDENRFFKGNFDKEKRSMFLS